MRCLLLVCLSVSFLSAQSLLQRGQTYLLRLLNGDLLEGEYLGDTLLGDTLPAWRFRTVVGTATVIPREVAEITPQTAAYRHRHRIFLQPTAEPVAAHPFIGLAGLFALYGGLGFQDWLSIVGAHTLLPSVPAAEQLWAVNTKFTLLSTPNILMPGWVSIAVGAQVSALNRANQLLHLYLAATFVGQRSQLNALIFAKAAGADLMTVRAGSWGSVTFGYGTGSIGIGVGLDTQLPTRRDLHVLAELWNSDIRSPSRSGLFVGVRLANTVLALDFGLFWFGYPFVVPAANVVWTPL